MSEKPLSDGEAYQRLINASDALGEAAGETVHADTALKAARRALTMIQMGLVKAVDDDQVDIRDLPVSGPPRRPAAR